MFNYNIGNQGVWHCQNKVKNKSSFKAIGIPFFQFWEQIGISHKYIIAFNCSICDTSLSWTSNEDWQKIK